MDAAARSFDAIYYPQNKRIWYLLAYQGGLVNVGGFLAVHRFVSHVTGFAGHFSIQVFAGDLLGAFFALTVPMFFLIGSFVTGLFTEVRRLRGRRPVYVWVMSASSLIYLLLGVLGQFKVFGEFGEPFVSFGDYVLLSSLCFAMGAQNALFTSYSSAVVRTTHLTGITTDLGIGWAKQLYNLDPKERLANPLRLGLISSFLFGSLSAVPLFNTWQFMAFLVPCGLSLMIGMILFYTRTRQERLNLQGTSRPFLE